MATLRLAASSGCRNGPPLRHLRSFASVSSASRAQPLPMAAKVPLPPLDLVREPPKQGPAPGKYFNPSNTHLESGKTTSGTPQDENKVNLGKTLRILQERLPTLLQSPLPQDILAPNISLHLFPSTHPHLPTVSGRVAYNAALWTSPIAWNRFPIVGNVKLSILSERMTKEPLSFAPHRSGAIAEQLVVRWCARGKGKEESSAGSGSETGEESKNFTGIFIFQFDSGGRVLSHTIEHVQESGDWEQGVGAKVVGLTDWLLGGIRGRNDTPCPAFDSIGGKK